MNYHFIGIGGISMSGLAHILLKRNKKVTGSDLKMNDNMESLKKLGAKINIGHDERNIKNPDYVIYSSSISKNNKELKCARKNNIKILHRSDLLNILTKDKDTILITGTHGKTTCTSLLTEVFLKAKKDPSFAIGGILQSINKNAKEGSGEYFIIEADESDGSFLKFQKKGAIVTNLEKEHLDYWKNFSNLKKGFLQFFSSIKEKNLFFWCKEDKALNSLNPKGVSYGFFEDCDLYAYNIIEKDFSSRFDINFKGKIFKNAHLNLLGRHNILNALGVFGLSISLGIDEKIIFDVFSSFKGVKRRMDFIGKHKNILFIDDYAHHFKEVKETLDSLKNTSKERNIVAVFQPHRYSRLKNQLYDLLNSFTSCDHLIITDVYKAGEKKSFIDGRYLKEKMDHPSCVYMPLKKIKDHLFSTLKPHDIIIFLGAGDISKTAKDIFKEFSKDFKKKIKIALFYGGRSKEHEVSKQSMKTIFENLDKDIYDINLFYISKKGKIFFSNENFEIEKKNFSDILKAVLSCDIAFPILHGPYGEDGMIQGFFETINMAYVGCSYISSVLCMNKSFCKYLMRAFGVKTGNFMEVRKYFWEKEQNKCLKDIKRLKFPLFIKPNSLGSSLGIYKVKDQKELKEAIGKVFLLDDVVLIEEEIKGKEIEFALLGNEKVEVSFPGEILCDEFYDFEKKYGKNIDGVGAIETKVPADISKDDILKGQKLACKIYKLGSCQGMARIDFFFKDGEFIFNEINTIPGFTKTSFYHKMWEKSKIDIKTLLDRLIVLGMRKKGEKKVY